MTESNSEHRLKSAVENVISDLTGGIPFWGLGATFNKEFDIKFPEVGEYNADIKLRNFRKAYRVMRWSYWRLDRTRAGLTVNEGTAVITIVDPAEVSKLEALAVKTHQAYDRALSRYTGKKVKTDRPEPYLGE